MNDLADTAEIRDGVLRSNHDFPLLEFIHRRQLNLSVFSTRILEKEGSRKSGSFHHLTSTLNHSIVQSILLTKTPILEFFFYESSRKGETKSRFIISFTVNTELFVYSMNMRGSYQKSCALGSHFKSIKDEKNSIIRAYEAYFQL